MVSDNFNSTKAKLRLQALFLLTVFSTGCDRLSPPPKSDANSVFGKWALAAVSDGCAFAPQTANVRPDGFIVVNGAVYSGPYSYSPHYSALYLQLDRTCVAEYYKVGK